MTLRLFLAIELSDVLRRACSKLVDQWRTRCSGVRWIPEAQWHLTVKFLGEVADARVHAVCKGMEKAAAASEPFELKAHGCGCFPLRGGVRIVWAGVEDHSGQLLKCVEAVENEMEQLGFARESRPFAAHITLGRVKEDTSRGKIREVVETGSLLVIEQGVTELVMMSSVLKPTGSEYGVVCRANLSSGN